MRDCNILPNDFVRLMDYKSISENGHQLSARHNQDNANLTTVKSTPEIIKHESWNVSTEINIKTEG